MSRRTSAGEHVEHDEIGSAVAQPAERLASVGNLHRHPHSAPERQLVAYESRDLGADLDRPLPGPAPGCLDVARESQCSGAEMHDRERNTRLSNEIDDVAEATYVLERKVGRVVEVDVGLRCAVHQEQPAGRAVGVGLDNGGAYSWPFVDGMPITRASRATASRRARATPLNCASTT